MTKVFLGGTCNKSTWRDELIPLLKIDYFNPVVNDWTPECQAREIEEREKADFKLFVITAAMTGVFSIAEAVEEAIKNPIQTILVVIEEGFSAGQLKSLKATSDLIKRNGAYVFDSLHEIAEFLNKH